MFVCLFVLRARIPPRLANGVLMANNKILALILKNILRMKQNIQKKKTKTQKQQQRNTSSGTSEDVLLTNLVLPECNFLSCISCLLC